MIYEPFFWITLVLTLASILFSRRDLERWRRMLAENIILMGLCAFSGALAFVPGASGIVLGMVGLLTASLASMRLTRNGFERKAWSRRSFRLSAPRARLSPAEEMLREQDRLDRIEESRRLGSRRWWVFLPALGMGVTAVGFASWLMGAFALGAAGVAAFAVQPAFSQKSSLAPSREKEVLGAAE